MPHYALYFFSDITHSSDLKYNELFHQSPQYLNFQTLIDNWLVGLEKLALLIILSQDKVAKKEQWSSFSFT